MNKSFWTGLNQSLNGLVRVQACHWWCRALVGTTFICLGATLSQRFIWEPQLKVGTVSVRDLVVPQTAKVVDVEATRLAIQEIRRNLPLVYQVDQSANLKSRQKLEQLINLSDLSREQVGKMPYFPINLVSFDTQLYLRSCAETSLRQIEARSRQLVNLTDFIPNGFSDRKSWEIARLISSQQYAAFSQTLAVIRSNYLLGKASLAASLPTVSKQLLDLTEIEWQQTKNDIQQYQAQILAGGVVAGLPLEMRLSRIRETIWSANRDRRAVSERILDQAILPNLKPDYLATEQLAIQKAQSIEPRLVTLAAGTVIVKAGDRLSEREFAFLDSLGLTQRQLNVGAISLVLVAVAGGMLLISVAIGYGGKWLKMRLRLPDLVTVAIVATTVTVTGITLGANFGITALPFIPLAATGMILGSFYGNRLAVLATGVLGFWLWLGLEITGFAFLPVLLGAVVAAAFTNRPHTRSQVAMIGLLVAVVQAVSYLILATVSGNLIVAALIYYGAGGLICSMVALGAIPYLEQISYHPTPIRLAELANLDRPLLRRLVTEAPGTFQHTLFVANLAEAGARELGADTTLVRTGTLYHDVGKTLKPEYFIENQMGQTNPHDLIDDPWHSAEIIKQHVSGGLKLAQKYRLPLLLQAFIPEHQGTIAISYFYYKAKEKLPQVTEDQFRYPGPIPQSRETAIVMLADACEAALRSLGHDSSLTEAIEMVNRIFQKRWDDGQLLDSELSLADLAQLAPVFIKVWQQHNHGRIKYPALALKLDPTGSSMPESTLAPAKV